MNNKKIIQWSFIAVTALGLSGCKLPDLGLGFNTNLIITDGNQTKENGTGDTTRDTTPPVITLKGDQEMTVQQGETFVDPGATATDDVDGAVAVRVSGTVDTSRVGTYTLVYTAQDKSGNTAQVTRSVTVAEAIVQPPSDATPPVITLKGSTTMTLHVGDHYQEPGASATDDVDGKVAVQISGTVDTSRVGTYTLTYTARDKAGNTATATRTVKVVKKEAADTTPPVITLKGEKTITLHVGDRYREPGATATDDVDGVVRVNVRGYVNTYKAGTYILTYTARDRAGNTARAKRTVKVIEKDQTDTTPPVITLKGARTMTLKQGETFKDPGATATDDVDGAVTVQVSGTVDTSKVGTYTLTYTARDKAGNTATATRTVKVVKKENNAQADVRKGPYVLYDGIPSEMDVLWQLESTQKCTIDWGTGSATTQEGTSGYNGHLHHYTIKNLTPATLYNYSVECDNGKVGSGSFNTAPSDDATAANLFVYGDTRTYPGDHDRVVSQMIKAYSNDGTYQTLVLHSGDFVSDGTRERDWDSEYFDKRYTHLHRFQSEVPAVGVRGNHEGDADLLLKYFPYSHDTRGYYRSFDYGPAHIAIVDQYLSYGPGSMQYKWLENDLKNSTKKWKFILLHEPGWSAGGHHNNSNVQNYIQPLAKKYGVSFIFSGHNHYYARASVDGVQHVTTGGGGAPLYRPRGGEHIVKSKMVHHFCTVHIEDGQLLYTVTDENGHQIDTLTLTR